MGTPKTSLRLTGGIAAWAITTLVGVAALWSYSSQPGQANAAPQHWPADSEIALAADRMTLLMAIHPHCPCTRSSIAELARLMRFAQGRVDCIVLIHRPEGVDEAWIDTGLTRSAEAIPGVRTHIDHAGNEARRLGMATSGAVALYDTDGRRCFTGGITPARGHEGANAGRDAILALLDDPTGVRASTPVFGCQLETPDAQESP